MHVATGSASTADVGVQLVVDRRGRSVTGTATSSPKPPGRRPADELRGPGRRSRARSGSSGRAARHLRVHGHAARRALRLPARRPSPRRPSSCPMISGGARRGLLRGDALDVAPADPGALDPDQHLALRRRGHLHVEDVECPVERVDESAHRGSGYAAPVDEHLRVHLRGEHELLGLEVLVGDVALREAPGPADDPGKAAARRTRRDRSPRRSRRGDGSRPTLSRQPASVRTAGWSSGTSSGGK